MSNLQAEPVIKSPPTQDHTIAKGNLWVQAERKYASLYAERLSVVDTREREVAERERRILTQERREANANEWRERLVGVAEALEAYARGLYLPNEYAQWVEPRLRDVITSQAIALRALAVEVA